MTDRAIDHRQWRMVCTVAGMFIRRNLTGRRIAKGGVRAIEREVEAKTLELVDAGETLARAAVQARRSIVPKL